MSEPVPYPARDDVLASIRRLVLEDPPRPANPGRLVLTPALRVAPPDPGARRAMAAEPPSVIAQAVADSVSDLLREGSAPNRPDATAVDAPPSAPASPRGATAAERVQGIGDGLSRRKEDWEPDGGEQAAHWSLSEVPAEPVFRHRVQVTDPSPPPAIDDDRLRRLIAEVVREELQGELGERMTRNIRRLVRREIFRVLESRDD